MWNKELTPKNNKSVIWYNNTYYLFVKSMDRPKPYYWNIFIVIYMRIFSTLFKLFVYASEKSWGTDAVESWMKL